MRTWKPPIARVAGAARSEAAVTTRVVVTASARAVLYLASPGAEMASGTVLDVNGASFLRM